MATNDQAVHFMNFLHENYETYRVNVGEAWHDFKLIRQTNARTSLGPVNCAIRMTYQGEVRDSAACRRCGRNDDQGCPFFTPDGVSR
jgi:hypothetical protein